MRHTPGPWTYEIDSGEGVWWIDISAPLSTGWNERKETRDKIYANAALMAAAPELLDALKVMVQAFTSGLSTEEALSQAKAAIEKAETVE